MRQIETDKHLRLELHGAGEATSTDGTFKRSVKNFALRARLHNIFSHVKIRFSFVALSSDGLSSGANNNKFLYVFARSLSLNNVFHSTFDRAWAAADANGRAAY